MMCNLNTCFWEVFKFTSNILYNVKNMITNKRNDELFVFIHSNFIEVHNKITYYIQKENKIINETSLFTIINRDQINKITTNYFLPYIIVYYQNKTYNLELHSSEYTFYIEGNKINREMITFYMKQKENIIIDKKDEYSIEFLNDNLKTTVIDSRTELLFEKDFYKLI